MHAPHFLTDAPPTSLGWEAPLSAAATPPLCIAGIDFRVRFLSQASIFARFRRITRAGFRFRPRALQSACAHLRAEGLSAGRSCAAANREIAEIARARTPVRTRESRARFSRAHARGLGRHPRESGTLEEQDCLQVLIAGRGWRCAAAAVVRWSCFSPRPAAPAGPAGGGRSNASMAARRDGAARLSGPVRNRPRAAAMGRWRFLAACLGVPPGTPKQKGVPGGLPFASISSLAAPPFARSGERFRQVARTCAFLQSCDCPYPTNGGGRGKAH